jgi:transcription initiation factor TFIIB
MSQIAGIPKLIIDDALRYHKKISDYELSFRGDNRDGILAASIYISCRINNYPRTPKEISQIFHLDVTSATRGCKNALGIINSLERELSSSEKTVYCKTTPEAFIDRYCSKLSISEELTRLCKFISIKIETKNMIPENTPQSIAAGIVFFISHLCNLAIRKSDVHRVSEISEVTINKCYKKLDLLKTELIPASVLRKYA